MVATQNYIPYQHCLAYLKQRSASLPYSGKDRMRLMEDLGMSNYNKFYRRREQWDGLRKPIPLGYLERIGLDLSVLEFCLQLDKEAYEAVLAAERTVAQATGIKSAICCFILPMPDDKEPMSEQEAVMFLHDRMSNQDAGYPRVHIHFDRVITHVFEKGRGHTETRYYYPTLMIQGDMLVKKTSQQFGGILGLDST